MKALRERYAQEFKGISFLTAITMLVFGGLLVLVSPEIAKGYAVAGAVALFIAFVAYPWQKGRDRQNDIQKEQRQAYREFAAQWFDVEMEIARLPDIEGVDYKAIIRMHAGCLPKADKLIFQLGLSAGGDVLEKASELHRSLYADVLSFGEKVSEKYAEDKSALESANIVKQLRDVTLASRDHRKKTYLELVSVMRQTEFDGSGMLTSNNDFHEKLSKMVGAKQ